MDNNLTLGSLFDGSGGFPFAGNLCGITPVWSSEIEPFPIRVTEKRLPDVKHYGDITKLNGAELEPVDIITFGSPCQDMSIAGKRSGLGGSRSNLFFEAVRIIKEMRCATNGKYPRYAVWENVCGAFSSNDGEDFRCVLETLCEVKAGKFSIPRFEKWKSAGEIVGDGFSLAWRTLDAQFWGVPQRRRRIFLVADFGGQRAGKILFESEGLSGYLEKSRIARKGTAGGAEKGSGTTVTVSLNAAGFCTEHSANSRGIGYEEETSPTIRAGTVPAAVFTQFGKALANAEEDAFLNGDGKGKPTGIFASAGGGTSSAVTAKLSADDILNLVYALKRPYRKNAKFILNDKTLAALRILKDNNGAYIWQPAYQSGEPDRLAGFEVHTSAYAPENEIAFGDYSYYNIGDRGSRSFKQLTELFAGNGMVGFVAKERVDGKLILPEAVQILKINAVKTGDKS